MKVELSKALRDRHRWTEEEHEFLRREYRGTAQSLSDLAERLGVSEYAVRNQLSKLGLGRTRLMPYHRRTQEERDLLRRERPRRTGRELGVSEGAVAGKLGLGRRTSRNPWTPDEEELLRELVSQMPVDEVTGTLHRSRYAVIAKARQLGVPPRDRDGWYTR